MISILDLINNKTSLDILKQLVEGSGGHDKGDQKRAFVAYSQYSNAKYAGNAYSGDLNFKGYWASSLTASATSELSANNYAYSRTNSTSGSSSQAASHTPSTSILGHNAVYISEDGSMSVNNATLRGQTNVGTWVNGSTGENSIHMDGKKIFPTKRSIIGATVDMTDPSELPIMDYMRGTIGYNEKTKTLVVSSSNSSYQQTTYVYSNVDPIDSFSNEDEFYATLVNPEILPDFTAVPYATGGIEHKERGVVVACDNGDIIITKMIPSKGMYSYKITKDEVTGDYTVPSDTLWSDNWTTTYGVEQGNAYGIRHNITYDQTKVIIYSPSYYYGSGYYLIVIDVKTGKALRHSNKDSSYGYQFVPFSKSKLMINKSINADGNKGMSVYIVDIGKQFSEMGVDDEISEIDIGTLHQGILNNTYTSTDYPVLIPLKIKDVSDFK